MTVHCGVDCSLLDSLFGETGTGIPVCWPDARTSLTGAMESVFNLLCNSDCVRTTNNDALATTDFIATLWGGVVPAACECDYLVVLRNGQIWFGPLNGSSDLTGTPNDWINLADMSNRRANYLVKSAHPNQPGNQALDSLGGPGLAKVAADGTVSIAVAGIDYALPSGGGGPGTYVELTPATSTVNKIVPTGAAVIPFNIKLFTGQTVPMFVLRNAADAPMTLFDQQGWLGAGDGFSPVAPLSGSQTDGTTADIVPIAWLNHSTTGTPVSGIGTAIIFNADLPVGIVNDQIAGRLAFAWDDTFGGGFSKFTAASLSLSGDWINMILATKSQIFTSGAIENLGGIYTIALGKDAGSGATPAIGIGYIAIGKEALARAGTLEETIAIGSSAGAGAGDLTRSIAIGSDALTGSGGAISDDIVIGFNSATNYSADPTNTVIVGNNIQSSLPVPSYSVLIGHNIADDILLGPAANGNQVIIGYSAYAEDHDSIAIGFGAAVTGSNTAVLGNADPGYFLGLGTQQPSAVFHGKHRAGNNAVPIQMILLEADYATGTATGFGGSIKINAKANSAIRPMFEINAHWIDATATFKSQIDFGARGASDLSGIAISIASDGAQQLVGFLGAMPQAKQTFGPATAGATYTAAEQNMITKLWKLVRDFGLAT